MKVSVIVAAYNIEDYIEKCLKSIINQMLGEIEIIVVDDGSTDSTLEIIRSISIDEKRIVIVDKENEGVIESRKSGLKLANGEYIIFVDGDDWLELDTLDILYNKSIECDYDIVMYNAFWSYDNRREKRDTYINEGQVGDEPLKNLLIGYIMPSMCFKFIKREFLINNKIEFPSDISFAEDLATMANCFMYNPQLGLIEENLYNYYQRDDSITKKISPKILEIDRALSFIEGKLKEKDLYELYKNEFEYTAFIHLFYYKILIVYKLEEVHKKLYKQFRNRKIDIYNNVYIVELINKEPISFRMRVKLYNASYYLGRTYDVCRKILRRLVGENE